MKFLAFAAVALSLSVASQAHAIVAFSIGAVGDVDPGLAPGETAVVTFDGPTGGGVTGAVGGVLGAVGLFTGTDIDVAATPVGDTSQFEAIQPGGWAKFDFSRYPEGVGSLSVYVGSIDIYNKFKISTSLRNYYYDGTDFLNHDGDQFSHLTNRRVYFQFAPTETFKSITFSSNGIAFEYDTIAAQSSPAIPWTPTGDDVQALYPTAVPEPAAWATMLTGFALVGVGARRRRSAPTA